MRPLGTGYWVYDPDAGDYYHPDTKERRSRMLADARTEYEGGAVRETQEGKTRYDLVLAAELPMEQQLLHRWAARMTEALAKYPERNWEKMGDLAALDRAKASAFRHFLAWMTGAYDEDHAAAVVCNLQIAELIKYKMDNTEVPF